MNTCQHNLVRTSPTVIVLNNGDFSETEARQLSERLNDSKFVCTYCGHVRQVPETGEITIIKDQGSVTKQKLHDAEAEQK